MRRGKTGQGNQEEVASWGRKKARRQQSKEFSGGSSQLECVLLAGQYDEEGEWTLD